MSVVRYYLIHYVDKRGKLHKVHRRYSEFECLLQNLIRANISKFIFCAFPPKQIADKFTDRTQELQKWLRFVRLHFMCEELENWMKF